MILIASDHAGFCLKNDIIKYIRNLNNEIQDLGPTSIESVDYPDYAKLLALAIKPIIKNAFGILVCGSGIGMSMSVNRFSHIRGALVNEPLSAKLARLHNDANVLCLGARLIGFDMAKECIDVFLNTPFEGGRHSDRVKKMS